MKLRYTVSFTTLLVSLLISACGLQVINGSGTIVTEARLVNVQHLGDK